MMQGTPQSSETSELYSFPPNEVEVYADTPLAMLNLHDLPDVARALSRFIIIAFLTLVVLLISIPWQQTSPGDGRVTAYLPQERVQNLHASVSGRIKQWYTREGVFLKQGDPILELVDIDPLFLQRIEAEKRALEAQYEAAATIAKTAKIDMGRQTDLFSKGISARRDMEQAIMLYKNAESAKAQAMANLIQVNSRLSRQQSQILRAPVDGAIVRLLVGTSTVVVEQGQVVGVFAPTSERLSVELLIPGRDLPLVREGQKVRLQFEGWPAVQMSGWPSVAIGTFGGEVAFVDQSATTEGLFRVMVLPEEGEKWPETRFIRQGTRASGWILLNEVSLGFEIWRQFNGFPPSLQKPPESLGTPTMELP